MKTLTDEQYEAMNDAYEHVCHMLDAKLDDPDNKNRCSTFNRNPFNQHWNIKTLKEVNEAVRLYLGSWVKPNLEIALDIERTKKRTELRKELEKLDALRQAIGEELVELEK